MDEEEYTLINLTPSPAPTRTPSTAETIASEHECFGEEWIEFMKGHGYLYERGGDDDGLAHLFTHTETQQTLCILPQFGGAYKFATPERSSEWFNGTDAMKTTFLAFKEKAHVIETREEVDAKVDMLLEKMAKTTFHRSISMSTIDDSFDY